jgi:hypothetical protein
MSYPGNPPGGVPYQPPAPYPAVGPQYGPPVSAVPGYGAPGYAPTTAVPAPPGRNPATLVLAGLTVVFFLLAVVFVTLYVTKNSAYNHQVSLVRQRNTSISEDLKRIDDLEQQLRTTKNQLNDAQQRQSGTQNQLDEITKEKQVISNCLNLYNKVVGALLNNDKNTFNANFSTMKTACDEASKYVN